MNTASVGETGPRETEKKTQNTGGNQILDRNLARLGHPSEYPTRFMVVNTNEYSINRITVKQIYSRIRP
jgi:hypothetical protein